MHHDDSIDALFVTICRDNGEDYTVTSTPLPEGSIDYLLSCALQGRRCLLSTSSSNDSFQRGRPPQPDIAAPIPSDPNLAACLLAHAPEQTG